MKSVLLALALAALGSTLAVAQEVFVLQFQCDGDQAVLHGSMHFVDPDAVGVEVLRVYTTSTCEDTVTLTSEPIAPPPNYSLLTFDVPDPGLTTGMLAYYVLRYRDVSDVPHDVVRVWGTCGNPIIERGWLTTDSTFMPCTGYCLLECTEVELLYADMLQYVGSNEVLELRGLPTYFASDADCRVTVSEIVPLGPDADCGSTSPVEAMDWGALKSLYR